MTYVNRYLGLLRENKIKLIIIYNDPKVQLTEFNGKIIQWNDFMKEGERIDINNV